MPELPRGLVPALLAVSCLTAALTGCESGGSLSGATQSCSSSGGFLDDTTVTCSGQIDTLTGNIGVEFGDDDDFENSSDTQRLRATFTAESGTARLAAPGPDGEAVELGTLEAGETLTVDETISFEGDENSIDFDAGEGGELRNVEYEGTATPL